jgi:hypothetical protein
MSVQANKRIKVPVGPHFPIERLGYLVMLEHCRPLLVAVRIGRLLVCWRARHLYIKVGLVMVHTFIAKKDSDFFQGQSSSFRKKLLENKGTNPGNDNKDQVELPSDVLKGSGCRLGVDKCHGKKAGDTEADSLGTNRGREDLGTIHVRGRIHGAAVEEDKQIEEEDAEPVADLIDCAHKLGNHSSESTERQGTADKSDDHDANSAETIEDKTVDPVHEGCQGVVTCVEEEGDGTTQTQTIVEKNLVVVDDEYTGGLSNAPT